MSRHAQVATSCAVVALALASACPAAAAGELPAKGEAELRLTPVELLGRDKAAAYSKIFKPEQPLSWQLYLPDSVSDKRPGVLVFVSPTRSGRANPRWHAVLDRHNVIYIGADKSGNGTPVRQRVVLAVWALEALRQRHAYDPERVYVAGWSGGGRVASLIATKFPSLFDGALYICGVDFWKDPAKLDMHRIRDNRYVFLTGEQDFNRLETKRIYRRYQRAGVRNVKLLDILGMRHQNAAPADLDEALGFLDGQEVSPEP